MINKEEKQGTVCPQGNDGKIAKWGFVRETPEMAAKVAYSEEFGVAGTAMEDYLSVIFPDTHDWVHDAMIPDFRDVQGKRIRNRPDFRSEQLKLIIEFDGMQHYTNPDCIQKDIENTSLYESAGYQVVRIPYFVQLTNEVVKVLFGKEITEPLFSSTIPSMANQWKNTPAYLCPAGIRRMAQEFKRFPQQYQVNMDYLQQTDIHHISEYELLLKPF